MTSRLSVNINDETAEALRELSERRGVSVTEVVRRAISVYKFVEEELGDPNKSLQVVDADKNVTTIQFVG